MKEALLPSSDRCVSHRSHRLLSLHSNFFTSFYRYSSIASKFHLHPTSSNNKDSTTWQPRCYRPLLYRRRPGLIFPETCDKSIFSFPERISKDWTSCSIGSIGFVSQEDFPVVPYHYLNPQKLSLDSPKCLSRRVPSPGSRRSFSLFLPPALAFGTLVRLPQARRFPLLHLDQSSSAARHPKHYCLGLHRKEA